MARRPIPPARKKRKRILQKVVGYATNIATLPGALPPWLADPLAEGIGGTQGLAAMHALRGLRQVRNNVKSYYERKPAWQVQYRPSGEHALRQNLRDKYDYSSFPRTYERTNPRPGFFPDDMSAAGYEQPYDPGRSRPMSRQSYARSYYPPSEASMRSADSYWPEDIGNPEYFVDPDYRPETRGTKRKREQRNTVGVVRQRNR